MTDKKIIQFNRRPLAMDADGNKVPLKACEDLAATKAGFQVDLAQMNNGFEITFTWPHSRLPADQVDGVLAVHDGGRPFLVPFYRGSLGVIPLHSPYIHHNLEKFLQGESKCLVHEKAGGESREYEVGLIHSLD